MGGDVGDAEATMRVLGEELRSLGMVVVPQDRGLDVRLSTLETIRIRLVDSVLSCEVRFGAASRTRARWTFAIVAAVLVPELFLRVGVTPASLSVAFLVVLAAVSQAIRYTVTEAVVSRIQMVWLSLKRGASSLSPGDTASLGAGAAPPFTAGVSRRHPLESLHRDAHD